MTYNFMITEYLRKSVKVEADSAEEAYEKISDLLASERIALDAGDFQDRDIQTIDDYENSHGNYGSRRTNDADYETDLDFTK